MCEDNNNRKWLALTIVGLNVAAFLLLFSPGLAALQKNIRFERLSVADGLSHDLVTSIAQDQQGFMWFATVAGLNRYDGYRIITYLHDPDDSNSISDNEVRYIFVDSQGVLWAATSAGLNRFNRESETFTRFRHAPEDSSSLSTDQLVSIYEDSDGALWIGTMADGLEKFDRTAETFTHYHHDPENSSSLSAGAVRVIYEDKSKVLWVGTFSWDGTADLNRFDRKTETFSRFFSCIPAQFKCPQPRIDQDRPPRPMVAGLLEDSNGALWIGGHALIKYDPASNIYQRYSHDPEDPDSISGNNPSGNIIEDRNGHLWFGDTNNGLNSYDPVTKTFNTYLHDTSDPNSISSNSIFTIFEDRSGLIWVATYDGGVNRFDPQSLAFGAYKHDPNDERSLSAGGIDAVTVDHDGSLWIGGKGPMLNRIDRITARVDRYQFDPGNPTSAVINALHVDSSNKLWIGHGRGLSRFDSEAETFIDYPIVSAAEDNIAVRHIAEDDMGFLWLGSTYAIIRLETASGALVHYRTDTGSPNGLRGQRFNVFTAQDGIVWISSMTAGISKFDPETGVFTNYQHDPKNPNSLSQGYARTIYPDPDGMIWIATNSGVDKFDPVEELFTHYSSKDGLPQAPVNSIVPDRDGNLWISTSAGLSRLDPDTLSISNFDITDGLVAREMGDGMRLGSGEMVFVSNKGINIFDPENLPGSKENLNPVLTDFLILNQSVPVKSPSRESPLSKNISTTSEITLNYSDYLFSFEFSALAYTNSPAIRYEYLLEGFDNDWIATDASKRFATYTNVSPGDYLLRVRASTIDDNWTENASPLRLKILPPLWQTWWAYTLYTTAFLLLLTSFMQWRTRLLRIRSRELKGAVDERTRELYESEQTVRDQADSLHDLLDLKERLFTNISHEFRTPLTLMLGPIDNLMKKTEHPETIAQLKMARRNGKRVLRLVDQLLELSRLSSEEPLSRSPQPLKPILEGVTEAFRPYARDKGITLSILTDENLWVDCDPEAVEHILMNLLSNALKFTDQGGRVNVLLREQDDGKDGAEIVELVVFDTGKGISHDKQEAVFERFKRADEFGEAIPGSGIGLALVKEITEAHGGETRLESEPGKGTVVTVLLPKYNVKPGVQIRSERVSSEALRLEVEALEQPPPLTDGDEAMDPGKPLVLVIEDNRDMQEYLRHMLSAHYVLELADNGEAGLEYAREHVPDIVLCDVMLPKMDGYQVVRKMKSDHATSHIPVIMLTARSDEDSKLEGLREHVDDFLTKPFNDEELMLRIVNLLAVRDILKARYSGQLLSGEDPMMGLSVLERQFMERLEQVMEKLYSDEALTMAQLADHLAMSVRQLQRKLKAITDQQPNNYLRLYRLKRSVALLKEGRRIGDIAYAVGFGSPSHFSSCFRAKYGCTPTEYQADLGQAGLA